MIHLVYFFLLQKTLLFVLWFFIDLILFSFLHYRRFFQKDVLNVTAIKVSVWKWKHWNPCHYLVFVLIFPMHILLQCIFRKALKRMCTGYIPNLEDYKIQTNQSHQPHTILMLDFSTIQINVPQCTFLSKSVCQKEPSKILQKVHWVHEVFNFKANLSHKQTHM